MQYYRPNNFPPVVKNLIIINVLVFVAQLTMENQFHLTEKLMLWPVMFDEFRPYQVFTHMFAHSPTIIFHIIFNMFGLWMFGKLLENVWGHKRFLFFYLACGLGAALLHMLVQYLRYPHIIEEVNAALAIGDRATATAVYSQLGPALGASGAVMGIFVAFGYLFPNSPLYIMFIPIPIKAKWVMMGLVAYDLFGGFSGTGDNIAHFAHLGGALTGLIIVIIWNKTNRRTLY